MRLKPGWIAVFALIFIFGCGFEYVLVTSPTFKEAYAVDPTQSILVACGLPIMMLFFFLAGISEVQKRKRNK